MEAALKQMKLIWVVMLLSAFIYVLLPEMIKPSVRPVDEVLFVVLGVMIMANLGVLLVIRRMYVQKAEETLRTSPQDALAILRWRQGHIVTLALGESIVLFGLVLRFIGATAWQAAPWYIVGIAAMLVFRPKAVQ